MTSNAPAVDEAPAGATALVHAEFGDQPFLLRRLRGGGNNQVYRVETAAGQALLKAYFHAPADPRDRLLSEFCFTQFCWGHGIEVPPRPLRADPTHHLGLYEFVEGRPVTAADVTASSVEDAASFFARVNLLRADPGAASLPPASEAELALQGHLERARQRVERLTAMPVVDDLSREAAAFVASELRPAHRSVEQRVLQRAAAWHLALDDPLPVPERCISPGDFGFHNALLTSGATVRFLDFEYAGWDEPAKMLSDFFWHPGLRVSQDHLPAFADVALAGFSRHLHLGRLTLVRPLCGVRWCCILLNEFLPRSRAARQFAGIHASADPRRGQLEKARAYLREVLELEI